MKLYSSNCKIEREDQALELIECEDLLNNCEIRWDDDADFIKTFFESHSTMLDDGGTLYAVSVDDLMMLYDRCRGSLRNHDDARWLLPCDIEGDERIFFETVFYTYEKIHTIVNHSENRYFVFSIYD